MSNNLFRQQEELMQQLINNQQLMQRHIEDLEAQLRFVQEQNKDQFFELRNVVIKAFPQRVDEISTFTFNDIINLLNQVQVIDKTSPELSKKIKSFALIYPAAYKKYG